MVLMMKTDVGWGQQGCPNMCKNLVDNGNLDTIQTNPPITDNLSTFYDGGVAPWKSSRYTPHHTDEIKIIDGSTVSYICNPGFTTNCLLAQNDSSNPNWFEGIFTEVPLSSNPDITYEIKFDGKLLGCSFDPNAEIEVRANNGLANNNTVPFGGGNDPDFEVIGTFGVSGFDYTRYTKCFRPSKDFSQIEFIAQGAEYAFVNLAGISVTCQTTALTDILSTNTGGLTYTFEPVSNTEFKKYLWIFGDPQSGVNDTSILALPPPHTFSGAGTYRVCLDIVDNHGCCAQRCTSVTILCPAPISSFTNAVNCNGSQKTVQFTFTGSGQGLTYLWDFGDGATSTLQNPTHAYVNNGNYNISLTITDACGHSASSSSLVHIMCTTVGDISCGRNIYTGFYEVDGTVQPIIFSQFAAQNGIPIGNPPLRIVQSQKFVVRGKLVIDAQYNFNNCDFVFDAGAELILNSGTTSKVQAFSNSRLKACGSVMWQGIKSVFGQHTFLANTIIEDAQYGIEVTNPLSVSVQNCKMFNNVIGIYMRSNANHTIRNNTFASTLPVNKSSYSSAAFWTQHPHAGIYFDNIAQANVGSNVINGNNIFEKMNNGIITRNSNLTCIGNTFINMDNYGLPCNLGNETEDPFLTCRNSIWIRGGGTHEVSKNTFSSGSFSKSVLCRSIMGANINIHKNRITGKGSGIIFINVNNSTLSVKDHKPAFYVGAEISNDIGIEITRQNANNVIDINNNDFKVLTTGLAIDIFQANDDRYKQISNNKFQVISNTTANNLYVAMLSSCRNFDIFNNEFISYTPQFNHIKLFGTEWMNLSSNTFINNSESNLRFSVHVPTNISNSYFECNHVIATDTAFNFFGTNNTGIDFRSNLMYNNVAGIRVQQRFTGQVYKGNIWVGANSQAVRINSSTEQWLVNPDQCSPPSVPNGLFKPFFSSPLWFITGQNTAEHCFGECDPVVLNSGEDNVVLSKAMELLGYLNDVKDATPLERWEWQTSLLAILEAHPEVSVNSAVMAAALQEMPNVVGQYKSTEGALSQILALIPSEQTSLEAIRSAIIAKMNEKEGLNATLDTNEVADSVTISHTVGLAEQLVALKNQESSIIHGISQRIDDDLIVYKAEIQSLPEMEIFHSYLKQIYTIKADMYLYNIDYLHQNHISALREIAGLCYKAYGKAAAEAVSLLSILGEDSDLNYDGCGVLEFRNNKSVKNVSDIRIYPNPGTSTINIDAGDRIVSKVIFKKVDSSYSLEMLSHSGAMDVSMLPHGVYIVTIFTSDGIVFTTKFLKIK